MATIVKRGKNFCVVFRYDDVNGNSQQKWETFKTKKEAQKRKSEVEHEIDTGTFIPPTSIKIKDFLVEFVDMYGRRKWGTSMYASNTGLIRNYINPIIGEINVQDMDARMVDKFIATLQKFKAVDCNGRRAKTEFVTPCTIEKICKLMRCAFGQAIRWGMVGRNPFIGATLPKREQKKRDIWDADTIRRALDACEDDRLYLAIHLAFACSLRFGEICGLTWDCVDISDAAIMNGNAYLKVEKVLARVDEDAVSALGEADIYFSFPAVVTGKSKTRLVLKKPKTESSVRKVWIPVTLAKLLKAWKESQDKAKAYLGDAYYDYNLVLTLDNGRPCEDRVIGNAFNRLKRNANLPNVVFHSLRHSSTTYKLKLNHGDIKATQGDTGHAQPDMVTEVYAHILDEDRKVNAQRFEAGFYARADLRGLEQSFHSQIVQQPGADIAQLLAQLQQNPQLVTLLNGLLKMNVSG